MAQEVWTPMQEELTPYGYCECGCGRKTTLARWNEKRRGWVAGEPVRFVSGHNPHSGAQKQARWVAEDRGHDSPCWVWQLVLDPQGYGQYRVEGRTWAAHRFYWVEANGPIPEGHSLHHLCEVPACVNPEHLKPLTHAEHMALGRKLSAEDVEQIRAVNPTTTKEMDVVGQQFGVHPTTIYNVVRRRRRFAD